MKTKLFTILAGLILFGACKAYANWNIYSDTDIHDGNYGLINIYDTPPNSTTVNMYGGLADYISTFDSSTLNFHGGNAEVGAFGTSMINILGGNVEHATTSGNGTIYFLGSDYTDSLVASDFGVVFMESGILERIIGENLGVANLYGGVVSDYITAHDSSTINVYGYDLVKTVSGGTYGDGQISGFWMNDEAFIINLRGQETFGNVNLIPEPSSLILLTLGALALRRKVYLR